MTTTTKIKTTEFDRLETERERKVYRALKENHPRRERGADGCVAPGCLKKALAQAKFCPMHQGLR